MARRDALQLGLNRKDGAAHVLNSGLDGVAGTLAGALAVEPGYEAAIAAALGDASEAVLVRDPAVAAAVVQLLKDDDAGRAVLLLESAQPGREPVAAATYCLRVPAGPLTWSRPTTPAATLVAAPAGRNRRRRGCWPPPAGWWRNSRS